MERFDDYSCPVPPRELFGKAVDVDHSEDRSVSSVSNDVSILPQADLTVDLEATTNNLQDNEVFSCNGTGDNLLNIVSPTNSEQGCRSHAASAIPSPHNRSKGTPRSGPTHDCVTFCPVDPTLELKVSQSFYTTVTCQPFEFAAEHVLPGLQDSVLFGIAMYNETPDFLEYTLESIIKTAPRFDNLGQRIVTAIFIDGINKADSGTVKLLQDIGLWTIISLPNDCNNPTKVHLFHGVLYGKVGSTETTMDVILVLKVENGGKLSSHDWLFNGLCYAIQPFQVTILDVGTYPVGDALFNQYHSLKLEEDAVICCSNIISRLDQWWNPVQQMQYSEYRSLPFTFALNSFLGVLHPTSGPCCAFRWKALCGEYSLRHKKMAKLGVRGSDSQDPSSPTTSTQPSSPDSTDSSWSDRDATTPRKLPSPMISREKAWCPSPDVPPLAVYSFSRENKLNVLWSNVYMAEDTFLGGEVARMGVVRWYPDIVALFDAPCEYTALVKQRKRWFNGGLSVLTWQISRSWQLFFRPSNGKSALRRLAIFVHLVWLVHFWLIYSVMLYGGFIVAHLYVAQRVADITEEDETIIPVYSWVVTLARSWKFVHFSIFFGYVFLAIFCKNPEKQKAAHYTVFTAHCLTQVGVTLFWLSAPLTTAEDMYNPDYLIWMVVASLPFYCLAYTAVVRPGEFLTLCLCFPSFLICGIPFAVSVAIRPLANIHDVSWGTKGLDSDGGAQNRVSFSLVVWRTVPITLYVTATWVLVYVTRERPQPFLASVIFLYMFYGVIGMILFTYMLLWCKCRRPTRQSLYHRNSS